MEPEGSLPHSQLPATCPYPEPTQSSPYPHFLKIHLNILPSTPGSPQWSLPQVSPPKPCTSLSPIRATCPTHHFLLDFIIRTILGLEYRSLSTSLFTLLHSLITSSLLGPNIILKHPKPTFLPQCERPSFTPIQNKAKLQFCIS